MPPRSPHAQATEPKPDLIRPPVLDAPYLSEPIRFVEVPNALGDWQVIHSNLSGYPVASVLSTEREKCEILVRQAEFHVCHRDIMSEVESSMSKELLAAALKVAIDAARQWLEILRRVVAMEGNSMGRQILHERDLAKWDDAVKGLREVRKMEEEALRRVAGDDVDYDQGSMW